MQSSRFHRRYQSPTGFSLIELAIAIALLLIAISALAAFWFSGDEGEGAECAADKISLLQTINTCKTNLSTLGSGDPIDTLNACIQDVLGKVREFRDSPWGNEEGVKNEIQTAWTAFKQQYDVKQLEYPGLNLPAIPADPYSTTQNPPPSGGDSQ